MVGHPRIWVVVAGDDPQDWNVLSVGLHFILHHTFNALDNWRANILEKRRHPPIANFLDQPSDEPHGRHPDLAALIIHETYCKLYTLVS
jgi:hypothetical protein